MTKTIPWPPMVGNMVRIKGSDLIGTVIKSKGVHVRRYRLQVSSKATGAGRQETAERRRARWASRWYGLDEIELPLLPTGKAD